MTAPSPSTVRITLSPADEIKVEQLSQELATLARDIFVTLSVLEIHTPADLISRAKFTKIPKLHGLFLAYYCLRAPGLRSDLVNAEDGGAGIGLRGMVDERYTLHFLVPPLPASAADFRSVLPVAALRTAKLLGARDPGFMVGMEHMPDAGAATSTTKLLPAPVNPMANWLFQVAWFGDSATDLAQIAAREAARRG